MVSPSKIFGRLGNWLFQSAFIYAQFRDGIIPDIFVQDYRYFDRYKDEIKKLFKTDFSPDLRIAIHVRRGDYVGNPFYIDLMKTDYYKRAMALFPNERFIVFSDSVFVVSPSIEYKIPVLIPISFLNVK